jgi:transcriptional regulator with XRE-family HTH domain
MGGAVGRSQGLAESLYSRIVADIREASLTSSELAEITGVRERQVQNWVAGTSKPSGSTRDRLLEVKYIVDLLRDVYTSEGIEIWIHARNRSLGSERPIDLLRGGEFREVLDAVERLTAGAT